MLTESNVCSSILSPTDGAIIENNGIVEVQGWAYTGGNRVIHDVLVSADGGNTWVNADLGDVQRYGWVLWKTVVPVNQGLVQITCKAIDSASNTQPESPAQSWNFKGYMNNSMGRVNCLCVTSNSPAK